MHCPLRPLPSQVESLASRLKLVVGKRGKRGLEFSPETAGMTLGQVSCSMSAPLCSWGCIWRVRRVACALQWQLNTQPPSPLASQALCPNSDKVSVLSVQLTAGSTPDAPLSCWGLIHHVTLKLFFGEIRAPPLSSHQNACPMSRRSLPPPGHAPPCPCLFTAAAFP